MKYDVAALRVQGHSPSGSVQQVREETDQGAALLRVDPISEVTTEALPNLEKYIHWVRSVPRSALFGESLIASDAMLRLVDQLEHYMRGGDVVLNTYVNRAWDERFGSGNSLTPEIASPHRSAAQKSSSTSRGDQ